MRDNNPLKSTYGKSDLIFTNMKLIVSLPKLLESFAVFNAFLAIKYPETIKKNSTPILPKGKSI